MAARPLGKALQDRSVQLRRSAALSLGAIGPAAASALPLLIANLKDREWSVRWASARALGRLGGAAAAAVPALSEALQDSDSRVCEAVAFALEGIGEAAQGSAPALAAAVSGQFPAVCRIIDTTETTRESGMDTGWTIRWAAARALGAIGGAPDLTTPALTRALDDPVWQVRGVAALSLGRIQTEAAIGPLVKALTDESSPVRKAAATSLGDMGATSVGALSMLANVLNDPDRAVGDAAREAQLRIRRAAGLSD